MTTKIFCSTENRHICFQNSPCVVTMQDWDDERSIDTMSKKGLSIKKGVDVVIIDGIVVDIDENIIFKYQHLSDLQVIDAKNLVLMPGLIDCHTHSVFAGSRANEIVMKSQGMSLDDIAEVGGGILATMTATRVASRQTLSCLFKNHAKHSLEMGVVLMEAKTGYGLNPEEERKLLESIYQAYSDEKDHHLLPMVAPTYFGLHAQSPDYRGLDNYLQVLIEDLPNIVSLANTFHKNKMILPLGVDIFLDRNHFSKEQAEKWLGASLQHGLDIHIHADVSSRSGGAELACELARRVEQTETKRRSKGRMLSIDHCQYSTESDLMRLAALGVVAVTLPSTGFFTGTPFVDAKRFRSSGIRSAIASNFNPGTSPANNIWFACYLALSQCGFSLSEVYAAVTVNAAHALGVENTFGKIECGKKASIVAFEGTAAEDFFSSPLGEHVRYVVK